MGILDQYTPPEDPQVRTEQPQTDPQQSSPQSFLELLQKASPLQGEGRRGLLSLLNTVGPALVGGLGHSMRSKKKGGFGIGEILGSLAGGYADAKFGQAMETRKRENAQHDQRLMDVHNIMKQIGEVPQEVVAQFPDLQKVQEKYVQALSKDSPGGTTLTPQEANTVLADWSRIQGQIQAASGPARARQAGMEDTEKQVGSLTGMGYSPEDARGQVKSRHEANAPVQFEIDSTTGQPQLPPGSKFSVSPNVAPQIVGSNARQAQANARLQESINSRLQRAQLAAASMGQRAQLAYNSAVGALNRRMLATWGEALTGGQIPPAELPQFLEALIKQTDESMPDPRMFMRGGQPGGAPGVQGAGAHVTPPSTKKPSVMDLISGVREKKKP